jgi:hypothetical protein
MKRRIDPPPPVAGAEPVPAVPDVGALFADRNHIVTVIVQV